MDRFSKAYPNESKFENMVIEQPYYLLICDYLTLKDGKSMTLIKNTMYKNQIHKDYYQRSCNNKSVFIITRFMRKYINLSKNIIADSSDKRMNALYYFKYYPKEYINSWYNIGKGWKQNIIKKYNPKIKDNATRFDLFNLIKKMDIGDTHAIGW